MPIMAANTQSDIRGAAWLLVSSAQRCIDNPDKAPQSLDVLNNAYRLLEAYRKNLFFGPRPLPNKSYVPFGLDTLSMMPSSQRYLAEIREAMEKALTSSFSSMPRDQAIEKIEEVLRALAQPDKFKASDEDKRRAKGFFSELTTQLADG